MIGEAIKEYRERRNLSREELGRRCGFGCDGERIIEAFERDEGFPDLEKLKKVAEALWVPLEVLCPIPCRECPYERKVES